jgi:hypothetical protein
MESPLDRGAFYRLRVAGVADSFGVPLEASAGEREFRGGAERRNLHFRGASYLSPTRVRLSLSEAVGGSSENATLYEIDRGIIVRLAGILPGGSPPGSEVLLTLDPETPLAGGRYRVSLSSKLRATSGSAVREGEGDTWILDAGVRAYPDPVRAGEGVREVAFAHVGEGATLRIFDAAGRFVRALETGTGASDLAWDLKNEGGDEVRSGTYFFRLTGAGRTAKGKFVVLR